MTLPTPTPKIIDLINQFNRDIEGFIRKSIESSFDVEKWSALSNGFETIRCWEIKGCRKEACPAYNNNDKDLHCWLKVGTLCGGKVQGEFAQKYGTCFNCEIFKIISENPIRLLYENLNTLVFHIKDKSIKLQDLAIKDQLTGLYNRHFFKEVIEREAAQSNRNGEPLSFIMIDLDFFKQINDTLGHLTGDKILIEAGTLIKRIVRKGDLLFRFGGDEFLVLLPNTNYDKSIHMVQRLLTAVDGWNKENAEAYGCHLSFSLGCSTYGKGCDILETLKEADARMYQNKMGKNDKTIKD